MWWNMFRVTVFGSVFILKIGVYADVLKWQMSLKDDCFEDVVHKGKI